MTRHAVFPALVALAPLALFYYLLSHPDIDIAIIVPIEHFYIVTLVMLLAAVLAAAIGLAGVRLRNIQVVFLGLAFSSLSVLLMLHGLATPGFLFPPSRVPAVATQLGVLLTAFWLFMSALPSDLPVVRALSQRQRGLVPAWNALLLVGTALLLLDPSLVRWVPVDSSPARLIATLLTVGLSLFAGYRYLQSYAYSRLPLPNALMLVTGLLCVSQIMIVGSEMWRLSWWLYHFVLVLALGRLSEGLWKQYATGTNVATAARGLFSTDPEERLAAGISPSIRALVVATEARDRYTAGHSHRVALHAVQLGLALGLAPDKLRALAQGGMVHDIGKLETPDGVLNKPDKLTAEEFAVIQRHPLAGFEMCRRLGFLSPELEIIRSHHERWDGGGYPDGLSGESIPLLARVLAITDVYDALTSDRSYRGAWSHERARQYIADGAGSQFDPACVEAWLALTAEGPITDRRTEPQGPRLRTSGVAS